MASSPILAAPLAFNTSNLRQANLQSDLVSDGLLESQAKFKTMMAQLQTPPTPGLSIQPAEPRLDLTPITPTERAAGINPVQAYIPPDTGVNGPTGSQKISASQEVGEGIYQNTGDTIINNLNKVRQAFDQQEARVNNLNSQNLSGTSELLAMQVELVKYSLLIDVTSKLTGKATQAVDVLMKGQ